MTPAAALRYVALGTAAVLLAGCGVGDRPARTPGSAPSPAATGPAASGSAAPSLVARADLAPCPQPAQRSPAAGGTTLPAVTLPCLGGGPAVRLGRLHGPLVVNLWATWCAPCRDEMPLFQRLHTASGDRLGVLGVDTEDRAKDAALSFLIARDLRYPSVYDVDGRTLAAAEAGKGLPVTMFIDAEGRVVHRKIGPYGTYRQLTEDVRQHLGVRP